VKELNNIIPFRRVFEGEGDPPPSGDPPAGDPPSKAFGQEDVDRIVQERLAKEKKKFEREKQGLLDRVQKLGLSAQQKEELEEQMEQLRLESATAQEQKDAALKKMEKQWTKERETLTADRDNIFKLYTSEKIEREILSAASSGENPAFNPQQIVDILSPRTRVVKELGEDGKPTGKMVVRVQMQGKKEDGTSVDLVLAPSEAVAKMKEDPERFGNLFKSGAVSGLGSSGNNGGGSGKPDYTKMTPEEFMKRFKQDPNSVMQ